MIHLMQRVIIYRITLHVYIYYRIVLQITYDKTLLKDLKKEKKERMRCCEETCEIFRE